MTDLPDPLSFRNEPTDELQRLVYGYLQMTRPSLSAISDLVTHDLHMTLRDSGMLDEFVEKSGPLQTEIARRCYGWEVEGEGQKESPEIDQAVVRVTDHILVERALEKKWQGESKQ